MHGRRVAHAQVRSLVAVGLAFSMSGNVQRDTALQVMPPASSWYSVTPLQAAHTRSLLGVGALACSSPALHFVHGAQRVSPSLPQAATWYWPPGQLVHAWQRLSPVAVCGKVPAGHDDAGLQVALSRNRLPVQAMQDDAPAPSHRPQLLSQRWQLALASAYSPSSQSDTQRPARSLRPVGHAVQAVATASVQRAQDGWHGTQRRFSKPPCAGVARKRS